MASFLSFGGFNTYHVCNLSQHSSGRSKGALIALCSLDIARRGERGGKKQICRDLLFKNERKLQKGGGNCRERQYNSTWCLVQDGYWGGVYKTIVRIRKVKERRKLKNRTVGSPWRSDMTVEDEHKRCTLIVFVLNGYVVKYFFPCYNQLTDNKISKYF